jgi:hypothetical protein
MMFYRLDILLVLFVGFVDFARAQYGFSIPDPNQADLDPSNDEVQGTIFNFIWKVNCKLLFVIPSFLRSLWSYNLIATWQPTVDGETLLDDDGHISLWITSWRGNGYTKCLAGIYVPYPFVQIVSNTYAVYIASVYSGGGGSWAWKIDLSDDDIDAEDGAFVYRLKPTVSSVNVQYDTTEREVPSRGFRIRKASDVAADAAAASSSIAAAAAASRSAAAAAAAASQSAADAAAASESAAEASASQAAAASQSAADASASQAAAGSKSAADASASQAAAGSKSAADASASQAAAVTATTNGPANPTPTSSPGQANPASTGTLTTVTNTADAAKTTGASTSTSTPVPSPGGSGLSAGAKAGIAIGVIALVILAIIAFLLWRHQQKRNYPHRQHVSQSTGAGAATGNSRPMSVSPVPTKHPQTQQGYDHGNGQWPIPVHHNSPPPGRGPELSGVSASPPPQMHSQVPPSGFSQYPPAYELGRGQTPSTELPTQGEQGQYGGGYGGWRQ